MSVRNYCRLSEHITHNKVGTLASDSGKLQKLIKIIRHPAVIFVAQHLHAGAYIPCLAVSKPARVHKLLNITDGSLGK